MADKDTTKTDAVDTSKTEAPSPSIPVPPPATNTTKSEADTGGSLITESAAEAAPTSTTPTAGAPNQPVVVNDNDVSTNQATQPNEKLAEEIEILTGEIQALEAKIERLTGGATAAQTDAQPDVAPILSNTNSVSNAPSAVGADVAPISAPTGTPPSSKPVETGSQSTPSDTEKDFVTKPQPMSQSVPISTSTSSSQTVSDLSPKPSADAAEEQMVPDAKESSGSGSGLEVIAEVVAVFGIVIFIILAISPFFREILGEDTYLAVQQIGWLTALGTLGLGLLLLLFIKGKGLFKFLLFFLLLITAVLFLAMNDNSLITPISDYISPLLDFYR